MTRVQHIINGKGIRGAKVNKQYRTLPTKGSRQSLQMAKQSKRIGRLHELLRRLARNQKDKETNNLMKRLYGHPEVTAGMVQGDLEDVTKSFNMMNQAEKREKLAMWKMRMNDNIGKKAEWINKKGSCLTPTVVEDGIEACSRNETVGSLFRYWHDLWREQDVWSEEQFTQRVEEITEVLMPSFQNASNGQGVEEEEEEEVDRPSLAPFRRRLCTINGCPGLDGWSKSEIKMISACEPLANITGKTMQLWEDTGRIPSSLRRCKLVLPGQFRPICVLSVWWRAWSATWLRAEVNSKWIEEVFPKNVAGGLPGSHGLEELAAVVAHQQAKLGHGISLDLSHAFDTVDRSMMESALLKLLPSGSRRWCELLFQQWRGMNRWIVYDKTVHALPLQVSHGIPQDDPAGPLVMNLLMHALMKMVDNQLQMPQVSRWLFPCALHARSHLCWKNQAGRGECSSYMGRSGIALQAQKEHRQSPTVDTSCRFDRFEVLGSQWQSHAEEDEQS